MEKSPGQLKSPRTPQDKMEKSPGQLKSPRTPEDKMEKSSRQLKSPRTPQDKIEKSPGQLKSPRTPQDKMEKSSGQLKRIREENTDEVDVKLGEPKVEADQGAKPKVPTTRIKRVRRSETSSKSRARKKQRNKQLKIVSKSKQRRTSMGRSTPGRVTPGRVSLGRTPPGRTTPVGSAGRAAPRRVNTPARRTPGTGDGTPNALQCRGRLGRSPLLQLALQRKSPGVTRAGPSTPMFNRFYWTSLFIRGKLLRLFLVLCFIQRVSYLVALPCCGVM